MLRRVVAVALLLVAAGLLGWLYTSMPYIIWDGGFDLIVRVSSDPGPPRAVACCAVGRQDDCEEALNRLLRSPIDSFVGEPLTVKVPNSGRISMSGRELQYFQFQYLVVVAVLPDGRRVGKIADIPDRRVSTELAVALQ
jgi:hypothetical protein